MTDNDDTLVDMGVPGGVDAEEIAALRSDVVELTGAIRDRDSRNRWIFTGFVIIIFILAFATWTALRAADKAGEAADKANTAIATSNEERATALVIACESFNNDTVDRVNGILLTIAAGSDDPEARTVVAKLLLPHRDCTEQGIEDYFDGDPDTDAFIPTTVAEATRRALATLRPTPPTTTTTTPPTATTAPSSTGTPTTEAADIGAGAAVTTTTISAARARANSKRNPSAADKANGPK